MHLHPLLERPAPWGMAYAAMLAAASYALWAIPTEVLPRFDCPQISIVAHAPGTSASEMETLIVRPLETELLGLQDLVGLRSNMGLGTAELTVRFRAGTDPEVDLLAANGAVDRARGALPPGVSPYAEIMGNAINEVADYGIFIPPDLSPAEVQRAIRTRVLPALRALPGVQRTELFGSGEESLWVQPDLLALRRHGVGVDTLAKTLADQVVMAPAGRLSLGYQDVPIEIRSLPLSAEAIRELPVPTADGPVPLSALARVVRGPEPIHYGLDLDGQPGLALIVFKQPGASTLPVTRAVAETLEALQHQLPAGVRWQRVYDQGYLVSLLRSDLGRNLLVGGALAVAVLFWVLGAQPGVWVLALSIPLALLFAIAGLYALGHSLNLLTLGALTVAVGLLADDGIIVFEAILHRWEQGRLGTDGVWRGLRDIAAPDLSGTMTTVSTYLPLMAVGGLAGLFFVPFALAMSLALLGSLAVSLTLIPVIAARLQPATRPGFASAAWALNRLRELNQRLLDWTIAHPGASLGAAATLLATAGGALVLTPTHFLPLPNEGVLLDSFTLPPGTSLEQTRTTLAKIAERVRQDPAVAHTLVRIGSASATAYTERSFAGELQVVLKPDVTTASLDALSARLLRDASTPGVQQSIDTPTIERFGESLSGLPQPFVVEVFGDHLPTLRRLSAEAVERLHKVPALSDIFNNDAYPVTRLRIALNAIALVGFLTLIGISLNHGIVLLHRTRQAEHTGLAPELAVREAVGVRWRPIVLTTLTAVLGMLPTALGWGIGAAPEQGLAVVILGGVLWSSILSTNLLPALYLRWSRS